MAEYLIQDTTLDAIADAINAKTGGSSAMTPAEMVTAIGSISGGGGAGDYELVDTYTVAEPVSQISITIPEWAKAATINLNTQDSASNKPTVYSGRIATSTNLTNLNTTQNHSGELFLIWSDTGGDHAKPMCAAAYTRSSGGGCINSGKPSSVLIVAGSSATFTGTFTLYARR